MIAVRKPKGLPHKNRCNMNFRLTRMGLQHLRRHTDMLPGSAQGLHADVKISARPKIIAQQAKAKGINASADMHATKVYHTLKSLKRDYKRMKRLFEQISELRVRPYAAELERACTRPRVCGSVGDVFICHITVKARSIALLLQN